MFFYSLVFIILCIDISNWVSHFKTRCIYILSFGDSSTQAPFTKILRNTSYFCDLCVLSEKCMYVFVIGTNGVLPIQSSQSVTGNVIWPRFSKSTFFSFKFIISVQTFHEGLRLPSSVEHSVCERRWCLRRSVTCCMLHRHLCSARKQARDFRKTRTTHNSICSGCRQQSEDGPVISKK